MIAGKFLERHHDARNIDIPFDLSRLPFTGPPFSLCWRCSQARGCTRSRMTTLSRRFCFSRSLGDVWVTRRAACLAVDQRKAAAIPQNMPRSTAARQGKHMAYTPCFLSNQQPAWLPR